MIEFQSVSKKYRDGTAAVVDLDLTIPSDKITVIVGPSGCGKTTTLRMINRMLEPTSGKIMWDDKPLRSKRKTALRRQMGYVIQSGGLFPHRTVVENISTVPGLLGWDRTKTRKRAMELLSDVGLERKLANRYPGQLSGGQQQRVGVARALCADPMVMLMDEPFSAVDPVVRAELHELILGLQQELSKTIVLITHDIDEAIKLGDQVAILRVGGKLAQVGTPQQLLDEPADEFVEGFVGKDRGYRAMSFLPAGGLQLNRVRAVRDANSVEGREPTLVIDAEARPLGWADVDRPGQVLGLGAIFDPAKDTMRSALDSALTSPVGLAVAVDGSSGRYAGTVTATEILSQVKESRASIAQSVSVREEEARTSQADRTSSKDESASKDESPSKTDASEQDTAVRGAGAAGAVAGAGTAAGAGASDSGNTDETAASERTDGAEASADGVESEAPQDAAGTETATDANETATTDASETDAAQAADRGTVQQQDPDVTLVGGVPVETVEPAETTEEAPVREGSADVTAPDAEPDETDALNTESTSREPLESQARQSEAGQDAPVQTEPGQQDDSVPGERVQHEPVQGEEIRGERARGERVRDEPEPAPDQDATTVQPRVDEAEASNDSLDQDTTRVQPAVQEDWTPRDAGSPDQGAEQIRDPDATRVQPAVDDQGVVPDPGPPSTSDAPVPPPVDDDKRFEDKETEAPQAPRTYENGPNDHGPDEKWDR